MRLDKFTSQAIGVSRAQAKKIISQKRISVDGLINTDPKTKTTAEQKIRFDGQILLLNVKRYLVLHKPANYICSTQNEIHPSALNLVIGEKSKNVLTPSKPFGELHFAGRLDVDTTGLVLISDDGQWTHRVTSPRKKCRKVYQVNTANEISQKQIEQLSAGVLLNDDEKLTLEAGVELVNQNQILLTLFEGRYHQVKRMLAAVGNHVESLHRLQIGEISLGNLAEGEWRALTEAEIKQFD